MAENRYVDRKRHRQERHEEWLLDRDMRLNEDIDRRDRSEREEQRKREELRHQHLLVAQ